MKTYLIYSGDIKLGKLDAKSQQSAENKGKKKYKVSVWSRELVKK